MKARDPLTRNYIFYVTLCVVFSTQRGAPRLSEACCTQGKNAQCGTLSIQVGKDS